MKVLIVSTFENSGGAGKAAFRLHESLLSIGVESKMIVQNRSSNSLNVLGDNTFYEKILRIFHPLVDKLFLYFYKNRKQELLFSLNFLRTHLLVKKINSLNPDIVHLHWINMSFIGLSSLKKINAQIVWTMHDNWVFTGGCHVRLGCNNYRNKCGSCPQLGSSFKIDLSSYVLNRKKQIFQFINNINFIAPSTWMLENAYTSSLLRNKSIVHIPNTIDSKIYKIIDKSYSRKLWNLPLDKKLILFGYLNSNDQILKGAKYLFDALNQINDSDIECVVFGNNITLHQEKSINIKFHYLNRIYDDVSMVSLYNACDVFIQPSLEENFSNVILEALTCSLPVVAFNIGGNQDLISHLENGYLAKYKDSNDLFRGINYVLNNNFNNNHCDPQFVEKFNYENIGKAHYNYYSNILKK